MTWSIYVNDMSVLFLEKASEAHKSITNTWPLYCFQQKILKEESYFIILTINMIYK